MPNAAVFMPNYRLLTDDGPGSSHPMTWSMFIIPAFHKVNTKVLLISNTHRQIEEYREHLIHEPLFHLNAFLFHFSPTV